jgi:hypothetical protein
LNNSALPLAERAAYHEAGHLVMARELRIRIDSARMPAPYATAHASLFASLNELCDLSSGNDREKRLAVQAYARVLLAGTAAILLRLEKHHGITATSTNRTRFRKAWLARELARGNADMDLVYSLLLGWGKARQDKDLDEEFHPFWQLALASYEYPTMWRRVQRLALGLLHANPPRQESRREPAD